MPFGIQYPAGAGQDEEDPQARMIQDLIASLETAPAPAAPPAGPAPPTALQDALFGGTPRHFAGALGDAIAAMAAVKAGGAPPAMGAFAASQQRQAELQAQQVREYQKRQEENAAAERMLRNQARISVFQEGQQQAGAEKIAKMKVTGAKGVKSEFVRDVDGVSHRFLRLTDPISGETKPLLDPVTQEQVYELDLGPAGYGPAILPGMVVDKNGNPQARFVKISKGSGGVATEVKGPGGAILEPQPPAGLITGTGGEQGALGNIPGLEEAFVSTEKALGGRGNKLDQVIRYVQAKAAPQTFGPIVAPQELVDYFSQVKSVLFPYVRAQSGATFPIEELDRYEGQFPIPGIDTVDGARTKLRNITNQMISDIRAKYKAAGRTVPGAGSAPADPAVQEYQQFLEKLKQEQGVAPTTP